MKSSPTFEDIEKLYFSYKRDRQEQRRGIEAIIKSVSVVNVDAKSPNKHSDDAANSIANLYKDFQSTRSLQPGMGSHSNPDDFTVAKDATVSANSIAEKFKKLTTILTKSSFKYAVICGCLLFIVVRQFLLTSVDDLFLVDPKASAEISNSVLQQSYDNGLLAFSIQNLQDEYFKLGQLTVDLQLLEQNKNLSTDKVKKEISNLQPEFAEPLDTISSAELIQYFNNQSITSEANYQIGYWQRHLEYSITDALENANVEYFQQVRSMAKENLERIIDQGITSSSMNQALIETSELLNQSNPTTQDLIELEKRVKEINLAQTIFPAE